MCVNEHAEREGSFCRGDYSYTIDQGHWEKSASWESADIINAGPFIFLGNVLHHTGFDIPLIFHALSAALDWFESWYVTFT